MNYSSFPTCYTKYRVISINKCIFRYTFLFSEFEAVSYLATWASLELSSQPRWDLSLALAFQVARVMGLYHRPSLVR